MGWHMAGNLILDNRLFRMIEVLNVSHKEKDKRSNELDLELQTIKFKLEKETEEKDVAEKLCKQLRDQLEVIEGKLTRFVDIECALYFRVFMMISPLMSRLDKLMLVQKWKMYSC